MEHPMPQLVFSACLVLLFSISTGCETMPRSTPSDRAHTTTTPTEAKWQILFDGSSTEHFRGYRKDHFPKQGWAIQDGTLRKVAGAGGGDIITKKQYSDFDLHWEWKVAKGANSGVMYRVAEAANLPATYFTGPEYQILDDKNHPDGKNRKNQSADLYALVACNQDKALKPVGQWNTSRIIIQDHNVKHYLNGKLVVEYTWASDEIKTLIAKSKFKQWKRFMTVEKGYIAFQDHGDDVWFRNIKIKDLTSQ